MASSQSGGRPGGPGRPAKPPSLFAAALACRAEFSGGFEQTAAQGRIGAIAGKTAAAFGLFAKL
jgi:hypothetical protein